MNSRERLGTSLSRRLVAPDGLWGVAVNRALLAWGGVVASFLFCYAGVLRALVSQWWNSDMYSYGFLVPGISLYLVWIRREQLKTIVPSPGYVAGSLIMLSGLLMLLAGGAGGVLLLQEISFIVTLVGGVVVFFGWQVLWLLSFPIAYSLFMIPMWEFVADPLYFPFQLFSANIGTALLQTVGVPVYLEGVYIQLPNITLEVAKVCSGINYLIAVIAIGIPMAVLYLVGWKRRTALVIMAVTIAILANGLRVAVIGLLVYYGLSDGVHGPYHILQGLSVSMIGYAAIFLGVWLLARGNSAPVSRTRHGMVIAEPGAPARQAVSTGMRWMCAMVAFLLVSAGSYSYAFKPKLVPLISSLSQFPLEIGDWRGSRVRIDNSEYRKFHADQSVAVVYRNGTGRESEVFIGYLASQEQGRELVGYQTNVLHQNASRIAVEVPGRGPVIINQVVERDKGRDHLVLFWYDMSGRIVADRYQAKLYTIGDALVRSRTNGAIVLVQTELGRAEDLPDAVSDTTGLVRDLLPILDRYLPRDSR